MLSLWKPETPQHPAFLRQISPELALKMAKNLPKIVTDTDVFVHCQGLGGGAQGCYPQVNILQFFAQTYP